MKEKQRKQNVKSVGNGEGSLFYSKKLQCWIFDYHEPNGKRKRVKQKKCEKVQDFKKRVRELKHNLDNNTYIESNNITIYELGLQIIETKLKRNIISDGTYGRSLKTLNQIKTSNLKDIKIQKATPYMLQEFIDTKCKYSNSYIRKIFELLENIFKEAMKQDLIIKNPMLKVSKPKSEKEDKKVEALNEEEQKAFVKQLENEHYRDVFIIALYTGMRMGEVLALKIDDIDLKHKEIHIQRTLTKDKEGKPILGTTTKTYAGNRTIPITSLFEKELRHAISNMVINENSLIFTQPNGKLISVSNMNSRFKRICSNAGLGVKPYTIKRKVMTTKGEKQRIIQSKTSTYNQHMLRHTYATNSIEAGVPAEVLQKFLGHGDIQTTINTYTTIFDKFKNKQIDKYVAYMKNRC